MKKNYKKFTRNTPTTDAVSASFPSWVSGIALLFSCLITLTQAQSSLSETELQAKCNQVGIDHNKGLDYVFNYLKKANLGKTSTLKREEVFALSERATVEFMGAMSYAKNEKQKQELEGIIHSHFQNLSRHNKKQDARQRLSEDVLAKMTNRQKEIMTDVFAVTDDLSLDLQASLERLDIIEERAKGICSRDELLLILSAISVGKHSLQYWHDNYEEWMITLGSKNGLENEMEEINPLSEDTTGVVVAKNKEKKGKKIFRKGWFRWKKVVAEDIRGAGLGVIFSLLLPPYSWGSVGLYSLVFSAGKVIIAAFGWHI